MRLVHLSLSGFRSWPALEIAFEPGHHLLLGPNGAGKTNVLEAIHLLGTGSSQRASRDGEMISHGGDGFRVGARLESGDGHTQRAEVSLQRGSRKRIAIDREPARAADLLAAIKVVSFAPDDVRLVQESAGSRRRFLDLLGSQISAEYLQLLREYQRALKQRNETLSRAFVHSRGRSEARRAREPWDDLVTELGSRLLLRRRDLVARFAETLRDLTRDAFRGAGPVGAEYAPGVTWEGEDPRPALRDAIVSSVDRDEALGYTSAGPQKDDLTLELGRRALRQFGSLGQQQLGAMFLKLAQADLVRASAGTPPLLLVDEMFAVLDRHAAEEFLGRVEGEGQIFLATAQEGWLRELEERRFRLHAVGGGRLGGAASPEPPGTAETDAGNAV